MKRFFLLEWLVAFFRVGAGHGAVLRALLLNSPFLFRFYEEAVSELWVVRILDQLHLPKKFIVDTSRSR